MATKIGINVSLLKKIQDHIRVEPGRIRMQTWREQGTPGTLTVRGDQNFPKCGTIGCIAGWTITLSAPKFRSWDDENEVEMKAARLLGISYGQAQSLFYIEDWDDLGESYSSALTQKDRAQAVIDRIDRFIAENQR